MGNKKPPAVPEKPGAQSAPKSVGLTLPDLKIPLGEFALKSRLDQLSFTDLALVAASLNQSEGMSERKATGLVDDAWVLLQAAACKMAWNPPQPQTAFPAELPGIPMSGSKFLNLRLGGNKDRRTERRREFYRAILPKETGRREISDAKCDEGLVGFARRDLSSNEERFYREIVLKLKESPLTARRTAERRGKGGDVTARLTLINELKQRGGNCRLEDLLKSTSFKKRTILKVVKSDPDTFTDEEVGPVREIGLKNSKETI